MTNAQLTNGNSLFVSQVPQAFNLPPFSCTTLSHCHPKDAAMSHPFRNSACLGPYRRIIQWIISASEGNGRYPASSFSSQALTTKFIIAGEPAVPAIGEWTLRHSGWRFWTKGLKVRFSNYVDVRSNLQIWLVQHFPFDWIFYYYFDLF